MKVAGKLVAQNEATYAAWLKKDGETEGFLQVWMELRKRDGNCLFVFAMVCKKWRKAQLKVGGPLRTRVESDVILPGRVALAKWALREGCPRDGSKGGSKGGNTNMAYAAARLGHLELVTWLIQERGFPMTQTVMANAAWSGNLELVQGLQREGCAWDWMACSNAVDQGHVELLRWARENGYDRKWDMCSHAASGGRLEILQWLRAEGCPWDHNVCIYANHHGHVGVLRWARENGCPWLAATRDRAARKLGYTDNFGNLVDHDGNPVQSDGEFSDDYSDEEPSDDEYSDESWDDE